MNAEMDISKNQWRSTRGYFGYYFCEILMENSQTKRHLEILGSMFTNLQIHFIIKVRYCRYASFCVIIDDPHCMFCPYFTHLEF